MTAAELRQRLRRVGIWMPPPERAGIDPAKTAAAIEGAGFTSVWVGGGNATPDALDRLRPLLAGSENLIVATGIANVWAWDPARLRAAAAALAADFPDRFILGLGVSHEPAVTALGHPYERPLLKMEKFLDELDHPAEHGADRDLPPVVLAALGGISIAVGTFVSLLVSEYTPLFGFMESGYRLAVVLTLVFDVAATLLLGLFVAIVAPQLARELRASRRTR